MVGEGPTQTAQTSPLQSHHSIGTAHSKNRQNPKKSKHACREETERNRKPVKKKCLLLVHES